MNIAERARLAEERLDRFIDDLEALVDAASVLTGWELERAFWRLPASYDELLAVWNPAPVWLGIDGKWLTPEKAAAAQGNSPVRNIGLANEVKNLPVPPAVVAISARLETFARCFQSMRTEPEAVVPKVRETAEAMAKYRGRGAQLWLPHGERLVTELRNWLPVLEGAIDRGSVFTGVRCALLGYTTAPVVYHVEVGWSLDQPLKYTTTVAFFLPSRSPAAKPEFVATLPLTDDQRAQAGQVLAAWGRELAEVSLGDGVCPNSGEPAPAQPAETAEPTPKAERERNRWHPTVRSAAEYITNHPGSLGKEIAKHIEVTDEHFRSNIVPKLKKKGFHNRKGGEGYFPPDKSM